MKLQITSYNSTGSNATRIEFIKFLLSMTVSILLVQESWHLDNNCEYLHRINQDKLCYPVSGVDSGDSILYGRPYGGLVVYYHKAAIHHPDLVNVDHLIQYIHYHQCFAPQYVLHIEDFQILKKAGVWEVEKNANHSTDVSRLQYE